MRGRSPEILDHRYNATRRNYDERQGSFAMQQLPSRSTRYEDGRLEEDHRRSRSPVYVRLDAPPSQYRERSPGPRYVPQEPIYRTRTPQAPVEEYAYERRPRAEYYRVYADEPRTRQPQYDTQVEYIQVSNPQGDYVIRRPVRREEPVYTPYEDGGPAAADSLRNKSPSFKIRSSLLRRVRSA